MIESFGRKLLWNSILIMVFVFLFIGLITMYTGFLNTQRSLDNFNDLLAENDRVLPDLSAEEYPPDTSQADKEKPVFYTVWLDQDGKVIGNNNFLLEENERDSTESSAAQAVKKGTDRGWINGWRYKISETEYGSSIAFVGGRENLNNLKGLALGLFTMLSAGVLLVSLLLSVFVRRMTKPAAALEKRQKQFITDAAHELKTPLTLMLTNVDILEKESGTNEWTEGMRDEGERMKNLIQGMITLTRADEGVQKIQMENVDASQVLNESLEDYADLMESIGLQVKEKIAEKAVIEADPKVLSQVFSILLDNALKYCDPQGTVSVSLKRSRKTEIRFENTCRQVDFLEVERLFDRFYRADPSRNSSDGFGIGLSMARSLMNAMNGTIRAEKTTENSIGFILVF